MQTTRSWMDARRWIWVTVAVGMLSACQGGQDPVTTTPGDSDDNTDTPATPSGNNQDPTPQTQTPPDTDVALIRLNTDGTQDTSFGTAGTVRVDLGAGNATVRDSLWSATLDAQGRLVLFGGRKADGRDDGDRVVVRLNADGTLDESFATKGVHTLNLADLSDNARGGFVQRDGKIVTSGYVKMPTGVGTDAANRVVLLRLDAVGNPDPTFGENGVVSSNPFLPANPETMPWGMAEAYAVGMQSDGSYVTTGYGYAAGTGPKVDMVSFRYTPSGTFDPTWVSPEAKGLFTHDVAGDDDRGRNLVVLSDDRIVHVGSGSPAAGNIDAMVAISTSTGALDTTFSTDGYELFDFERPEAAFFGVAVSPAGDKVVAVGHRKGKVNGVEEDDDAVVLVLPLDGGAPIALASPLSETGNDRFVSVVFDPSGKFYAAGYVTEGTDSRMVVARFNLDGTRDSTFGVDGVASVNVVALGAQELARAIVLQADGKIVLAGVAEHP